MSLLSKFGLGKSEAETKIEQISVADAHERELAGRTILIDVRRPDEWDETGRPQGSYGVTLQDKDFLEQVKKLTEGDETRSIAFTCKTGGRSAEAADRAKATGHINIANVKGGFQAWSEAGLPTEKGPF